MHRLGFKILGKTKRQKPLNLLSFQRFLSSFKFDYFAVMSDLSKSLENRLGATPQGFESLSLRQEKPQLNFQLRFFSYIRLSASYIASQLYYFVVILPSTVKSYIGEYNITVSVANNITFAKQKYHSALAEYHSIQFNLRTIRSANKKRTFVY